MDYRLRHHDGEFRWIQDNGTPRYDGQGNFLGYIGHCLDITERKRAEEKMRAISSRLHLATTSVKAGVWDWNLQTNQMIWDDRMLELYGLTREDFPGGIEAWEQGLHPKDAARAKEECQAALRGERDFDTEFRVVHPDGKVLHIKANGLVLRDEQGKLLHMIGLNSDITERKALEEQLRQAQKLESIGQLAGGVAHDFNNILASVMMHLSSLQENPRHDSETQESLAEVMLQVDRAANLTRQLLMFSRQSVMEVKVLDLSELVANLLKMLGRLIGEHILVQFNRREGWTSVEADAGMIEQVLMNLAVNARDAMPKGGTLTIGLEPIQVAVEHVKGNPEARFGTFVCLSVADTGCGMDDATVKRIFEPFFTTKEPGKGTGLGLATVNGIVAQHKGWVEVKSEPGKGTTFKIYLPAAAKKAAEANRPAKIPLRRGHETILLVEDEASVRRPVVRNLQQLGYRVLEASNGQVALEVWQAHAGQIDLLFSDMVMPEGLTGLDLAEKLRAEKPSLKVILSSGYNQEMAGHAIPAGGGFVFLQKPYQLLELSKTIRACLDRDEGECPGKLAQPGRRSP
jgi:PAS domain S-box-containing protein